MKSLSTAVPGHRPGRGSPAKENEAQEHFLPRQAKRRRPRLGFLGVGWIGRNRLEAVAQSGVAEIAAIADISSDLLGQASALAPQAVQARSLEDLFQLELDGLVIATPSALHAEQAIAGLKHGLAVFCQKPLGRNAEETFRVISTAREADLLLGVDFSYRQVNPIRAAVARCRSGELGRIFAVELVFHNAYGPDKAWFYDWKQSGGGCLTDLGIHLVDLALWTLGFPAVDTVQARMYSQGFPVRGRAEIVEDYAAACLVVENGTSIQLTCSWKLSAGCDAIISGAFYGTKGGVAFRNLDGSFYRFIAEQFEGTKRTALTEPEESWGGRALVEWAEKLARGERYQHDCEEVGKVADVLDRVYGCATDTGLSSESSGALKDSRMEPAIADQK